MSATKLLPDANTHWYLVHTKPRQEERALSNLQQQGFHCYLPLFTLEKLRRGSVTLVQEPLFARYLFIQLSSGLHGPNWTPIRSTLGVSRLVSFGNEPARISSALLESLREQSLALGQRPARLFTAGDTVQIQNGPFAGLQAVYQMADGEQRALVLIELLSKPCRLAIDTASLRKVA